MAEADNGQAAVDLVRELHPDIVLLDVSMPVLNGFQVAVIIRDERSDARVIIVSSHSDPAYVQMAFETGALAYVVKGLATTELPRAIEEVMNGRAFRPGDQARTARHASAEHF